MRFAGTYRYALLTAVALLILSGSLIAYAAAPITPGPCDLQGMQVRSAADKNINNEEVCAAYRFLLQRNGTGTRGVVPGCYRTQADRILKLNPGFAVGLYKALTEIEKLYGGKNIIQSGYRCDGTGGNHPRGCAVDIIYRSCQQNFRARGFRDPWRCSSDSFDAPEQKWIDANGKKAPYNIHLRLRYAPEGHHVEPVNTSGCVTGATVGSGPSAAPTSGLTNALRSFMNPPPPPPQMPSQPLAQREQPQLGQQPPALGSDNTTAFAPGTCPPQFYCKNDTYYYRASTCVDQVQKKCSSGCSKAGTTCAATSTKETSSAFEQIESIAGPTAEEVGTPVSDQLFELTVSGEDVATLTDTSRPTTTVPISDAQTQPPPLSEQTFISDDLRYSTGEQHRQQEMSAMQRVLATMKDTLLRVLSYLRPFGSSQRSQPSGAIEHLEYEYEY